MNRRPAMLWFLAASILGVAGAPAWAQDPAVTHPAGIQAITKPSKDVVASFLHPGRVADVLVSKGDAVKAGQKIAQEDDREGLAMLAIDKSEADDTTEIEAEKAVRAKDQVDYERLAKSGASAQSEIDSARLEVTVADARIKIAETKHDQAVLKYKQTLISVEQLALYAPITGVVQEEFLKIGEIADGNSMKVVRIVQLDPLWIEVPVPLAQARKLKKDDPAIVATSDGREHTGKVIVLPPVADSASNTLQVRVELPNPEMTSAGDTVYVRFPSITPVQVGAAGLPSGRP